MTIFQRYVGIDYSGARTPNAFLTGLRIYLAAGNATPEEIKSPARKYWTRRAVAEWLVEQLAERSEQKVAKVRRELERSGALEAVRSDVARGKALEFLVGHATAVDENGDEIDLTVPDSALNDIPHDHDHDHEHEHSHDHEHKESEA